MRREEIRKSVKKRKKLEIKTTKKGGKNWKDE